MLPVQALAPMRQACCQLQCTPSFHYLSIQALCHGPVIIMPVSPAVVMRSSAGKSIRHAIDRRDCTACCSHPCVRLVVLGWDGGGQGLSKHRLWGRAALHATRTEGMEWNGRRHTIRFSRGGVLFVRLCNQPDTASLAVPDPSVSSHWHHWQWHHWHVLAGSTFSRYHD